MMAPPQWAYHPDNFVNTPDEELICSICRAVFCDPVMTVCSHVFCKACLTKWLTNSRNCPICRKRVQRFSSSPQALPIVKNIILKLTVYCHNKAVGCEAQMSVESCESHMKVCNFELVLCKNKPCKKEAFRKDIEEHEQNGCPHRYVKCEKCGSKMSIANSSPRHNCTRALLLRLKKSKSIIRKKNEKIKELAEEVKKLKEGPSGSSLDLEEQSSSTLSDSQDDSSTVNAIAYSSDSSDSYVEGVGYYDSNSDQSDVYESLFRNDEQPTEFQSAMSFIVNEMSTENQNNTENRANSSPEYRIDDESSNSDSSDISLVRRAAKRKNPRIYSSSESDIDCNAQETSSITHGTSANNAKTGDSNVNSAVHFTIAGPSRSDAASAGSSNDSFNDASNTSNKTGSRLSERTKTLRQKKLKKMAKSENVTSPRNSAVFQRTLSLLEQYNLESDPEWEPAFASHRGDTTTDSDTDYDQEEDNLNLSPAESDS